MRLLRTCYHRLGKLPWWSSQLFLVGFGLWLSIPGFIWAGIIQFLMLLSGLWWKRLAGKTPVSILLGIWAFVITILLHRTAFAQTINISEAACVEVGPLKGASQAIKGMLGQVNVGSINFAGMSCMIIGAIVVFVFISAVAYGGNGIFQHNHHGAGYHEMLRPWIAILIFAAFLTMAVFMFFSV
ncbi:MAG: hypothetical protein HC851_17695 [Acaryochloris sp. RU_4_1]|nr:hypothetical protein [Acaryochloris sp. RU_4_1]NJR57158.1 hypothetical protein [Acaryochloris sp. CRU_2_0]